MESEAWGVESEAWSVKRGAWSVKRGAWRVERGGKPSGRHLFTLHTSRFTFLKKMGSVENWVRKNVYLCR